MEDKIYISKKKFNDLRQEVDRLKKVELKQTREAMQLAIDQGGMHDNAGYEHSAQREAVLLKQISDIEQLLSRAYVPELAEDNDFSVDVARIGTWIKVMDLEQSEECTYSIVGAFETDARKNHISYQSPLARGFIGKRVGDTVEIEVPKGQLRFKILEIGRIIQE